MCSKSKKKIIKSNYYLICFIKTPLSTFLTIFVSFYEVHYQNKALKIVKIMSLPVHFAVIMGTVAFLRRLAPTLLLRPMFSSSSFLISVRIALITRLILCSLSMVLTTHLSVSFSKASIIPRDTF